MCGRAADHPVRVAVLVVEGVLQEALGRVPLVVRAQPRDDPVLDRDGRERLGGDQVEEPAQLGAEGLPVAVVAGDRGPHQVGDGGVQHLGEERPLHRLAGRGHHQLAGGTDLRDPVGDPAAVLQALLPQRAVVLAPAPAVDHRGQDVDAGGPEHGVDDRDDVGVVALGGEGQPLLVPERAAEHPGPGHQVGHDLGVVVQRTPIRRWALERLAQVGSWCWPCCWRVTEPMLMSEPLSSSAPPSALVALHRARCRPRRRTRGAVPWRGRRRRCARRRRRGAPG